MIFPVPFNETDRLNALRELDILDSDAESEFDNLTALAAAICGTPISLIGMLDQNRHWFKSKQGLEISEVSRESAFCSHTILGTEPLIIEDLTADSRFIDNPLVTGEAHIRFYAGIPLVTDEGYALGTFCVLDHVARRLSAEQKEALRRLAHQAAMLIKSRFQMTMIKSVNQQLRISEQSYRVVTDSASDVIITIDEESQIIFANPAAGKVFGYAPTELVGQQLGILIPEHLREAHQRGMQRYMQHGNRNIPWDGIVLPCVHKNGAQLQVEISFGEHEADEKRYFTAVMRDTTERERAKNKLKTSEERYRFLAESIPQQVWTARPDGFISYGNRRAIEYFGSGVIDELSGMQWQKVMHPDDLPQTLARWKKSVSTGCPYEVEYRLLRSDGEYRWHLSQAVPMRDDDGKILRWYGTNTDIHDHKTAESAIREAEGYRNLFQHANDAILILDLETEEVIEANEKACQMYGFKRHEFLGTSLRAISQNPVHGDKYRRELQRAGSYQTFETVQYRTDGTPLELVVNSSVIDYHGRKVILSINRDVTERNRTDRLLTHNALHDALTKLPNRALFTEHLRHTIELHTRDLDITFAVLFLDFDRFKIINDSLGHTEGDNLLILFAARLKSAVRPSDVVARLGGDEFTILLDELADESEARDIADRIHDSLRMPFNLGGNEVFINVSIGIALSSAEYHDPNALLRDADIAMYRAKAEGRGRTSVFSQAMHEQASARLKLENELRQAVERREFCVYYQPIVDLETNSIKGFEALVRWQHPLRGIVSPLEFIPLAEETGLIIPLGAQVLSESCRQLKQWQTENPGKPDLSISVNLSFKQFLQPDLVECVSETLETAGLSAESLRLEVTESYLMDDTEAAIEIMHRLQKLGIKLSIDDFGTGYSSLSYLHRLPLDCLKIDRSFVSRMKMNSEDFEIVQTIITLAKNLNLKTIAEGVETEDQAKQLKTFGCDYGQGFLYSKPVPATEIFISSSETLKVTESGASLTETISTGLPARRVMKLPQA